MSTDHLEAYSEVIARVFDVFGCTGNGSGSFRGTMRNIISRTKDILKIPCGDPRRLGLLVMHATCCVRIFDEYAVRVTTMLQAPAHLAEKPVLFVLPEGDPMRRWNACTALITAIRDSLELEGQSLSRSPLGLQATFQQQVAGLSDTLRNSAEAQAVIAFLRARQDSGEPQGAPSTVSPLSRQPATPPASSRQRQADAPPTKFQRLLPPGVSPDWGMKAVLRGVYSGTDTYYFGLLKAVLAAGTNPDPALCPACYAPNTDEHKRGAWCTRPLVCTSTTCHARPAGITNADIHFATVRELPADAIPIVAAAEPVRGQPGGDAPSAPQYAWGRGQGRGGARVISRGITKGGGKAAGKGKGNGKGPGGAPGPSKGKGKQGKGAGGRSQGKGGAHLFQRQ